MGGMLLPKPGGNADSNIPAENIVASGDGNYVTGTGSQNADFSTARFRGFKADAAIAITATGVPGVYDGALLVVENTHASNTVAVTLNLPAGVTTEGDSPNVTLAVDEWVRVYMQRIDDGIGNAVLDLSVKQGVPA